MVPPPDWWRATFHGEPKLYVKRMLGFSYVRRNVGRKRAADDIDVIIGAVLPLEMGTIAYRMSESVIHTNVYLRAGRNCDASSMTARVCATLVIVLLVWNLFFRNFLARVVKLQFLLLSPVELLSHPANFRVRSLRHVAILPPIFATLVTAHLVQFK